MARGRNVLAKLSKEPPFRFVTKALYTLLRPSIETRALWDVSPRPQYLNGMLLAAKQARNEGVREICAIEFGVAGGSGLLAMQAEAQAVERATGVSIKVYGFDNGPDGLPDFIGDHRDHPDAWHPGDYPMDETLLRSHLLPSTRLVIGNIRDTVPAFIADPATPPIGFVAIDVDLYSSTMQALQIFTLPGSRTLSRTMLYFDDIDMIINHRFAGELLAIDEFNAMDHHIKIDRMRGLKSGRPFPEKAYLDMMFVAHDLAALSKHRTARAGDPLDLPLHRS